MSTPYPRIAIVTGSTSGIGEAITRKFISSGFGVVGNARRADALAAQEKEFGASFRGVAGDAADVSVIDQLFATAQAHFGRPADIVIVNAGRGLGGSVTTSDLAQFEEVLRTNVAGALALMQKAGRLMAETQQTSFPKTAADIVVIGSVAGRHVSPFSAAYGSTKFAVAALTEGLRREIGPKGVRVTLIEPAVVVTGFQAVAGYSESLLQGFDEKFGPLLVGDDVANAIHYAVSQPPHVHLCDILIRPTRQDYP
ncbi:SDR family oxidoreductase [Propionivibrio limicola]|uniref:SDR family oxidoreductase n=1 Tax=Propionivibrio limicola TaxID=167645 RepID=UPI00129202F6|nr:SDR family oxidoreductase [Propionivibrio limicola]